MIQFVQNVPVPCAHCHTSNIAREERVRLPDNSVILEARWTCNNCHRFLRRGVLRVIEEPKK